MSENVNNTEIQEPEMTLEELLETIRMQHIQGIHLYENPMGVNPTPETFNAKCEEAMRRYSADVGFRTLVDTLLEGLAPLMEYMRQMEAQLQKENADDEPASLP